jgi:flagellar protein FliO/FliZ
VKVSATRIIVLAAVLQPFAASAFGDTPVAPTASDDGAVYPLILSLVLILGAAAAATFLLRRWKGAIGRSNGPLKLIHVLPLGPRERLVLVKAGERYLIVGVTPTSVTKISELDKIETLDGTGAEPSQTTSPFDNATKD